MIHQTNEATKLAADLVDAIHAAADGRKLRYNLDKALERIEFMKDIFSFGELYDMSKALIQSPSLTAQKRFEYLNKLIDVADPPQRQALPQLSDIIADLCHYRGLAVQIALAWARCDAQPSNVATLLQTMTEERLLARVDMLENNDASQDINFAIALRPLYSSWSTAQRREFWDQAFTHLGSRLDNPQVIAALALKAVDAAEFSDWLRSAYEKTENHRQRDAIVRLWAQSNVMDQQLHDALTSSVTFDLIERHLSTVATTGGDIQSALLGLLTIRLGLTSSNADLNAKLNKKLEALAAKTPQLAVTVEAIMNRISREKRHPAAAGKASISE